MEQQVGDVRANRTTEVVHGLPRHARMPPAGIGRTVADQAREQIYGQREQQQRGGFAQQPSRAIAHPRGFGFSLNSGTGHAQRPRFPITSSALTITPFRRRPSPGMGRRAYLFTPTRLRVRGSCPDSTQLRARQGWIGLSGNARISSRWASLRSAQPANRFRVPFAMKLRTAPGMTASVGWAPPGLDPREAQRKRTPRFGTAADPIGARPLLQYQSFMPLSAGCTSSPPSTLMPLARIASLCQSFCARRVTYGRIAAEIACEEVCGTAPGMLVTQKCVTPSTT